MFCYFRLYSLVVNIIFHWSCMFCVLEVGNIGSLVLEYKKILSGIFGVVSSKYYTGNDLFLLDCILY